MALYGTIFVGVSSRPVLSVVLTHWTGVQRSSGKEPLQKDRRYMLAVMPHGVIPFASTCSFV